MLPRHTYLSATLLALAATMSEEDSPVVPSPDDLDASPDLWSTPLGRAMVDDMRADEEQRWQVTDEAMIESALKGEPAPSLYASMHTSVIDLDEVIKAGTPAGSLGFMIGGAGSGRNMYREYIEREAASRSSGPPDDSMRFLLRSWDRDRQAQRANKKARGKRKAKKGWA
jgi:hypothetical protein